MVPFVFLRGSVVGFDCISLSSAYEILRLKLLKSYAIDAVLGGNGKDFSITDKQAKELVEKLRESNVKAFDSVGYGRDFCFEGRGVIGSSPVWYDDVIHIACFKVENGELQAKGGE